VRGLFFAHFTRADMNSPTLIEQPDRLSSLSAAAASERRTGLMTDAERESLITFHGFQMQAAYARYEASSNFADRGDADYHMRAMTALVKARSANQVTRMEVERGLA